MNEIEKKDKLGDLSNVNPDTSIQSLVEINTAALEVVTKKIPEIVNKTQAFSRANSQSMLGLMSLTMLNGVSPMRLLRQVSAEIDTRRRTVLSSQVSLLEMDEEIDKNLELLKEREMTEIEKIKFMQTCNSKNDLVRGLNGLLKDLASLCDQYELIKKRYNISDDWGEDDFERDEFRHHVRRCFELLYRNLLTSGRAGEAVLEYLAQHGIHPQVALKETQGFIVVQEERINKGEIPSGMELEDFLDEMGDKYLHCPKELSQRMFGVDDFMNYDIMYKEATRM